MVIKSVNLETVIGVTSKIPQNSMPEIAFAGKSNVGKSSLDQRSHEQEVPGKNQLAAGQNTDNKFL